MNTQKLDGYVVWIYGKPPDEKCAVQQAILRDGGNELAVDCECPYPGSTTCLYTFVLRRKDALVFSGTWKSTGAKQDSGVCDCRVYSNGDRLACIGAWEEEGTNQSWYAELHPAAQKA
jgi:hypothetical protein